MIRQNLPKENEDNKSPTDFLKDSLTLLQSILFKAGSKRETGGEDLMVLIRTSKNNKSLKERETVLNKGLLYLEKNLNHPQQLLQELYIIGKLLERCYIHSTDIEYAQFYNKEMALRVDNIVNKHRTDSDIGFNDLKEKIDRVFLDIEKKKREYFDESKKELAESTIRKQGKEEAVENYLVEVG